MTSLSIDVHLAGPTCELALCGALDAPGSQDLRDKGLLGLRETRIETLVIDLSAVAAIDAVGMESLVLLRNVAQARHKRLILRGASDRVDDALHEAHLTKLFAMVDAPARVS
ncbi:MAG: STAS domain-containing protein [Actinobacteria bacterium]|nr:STAS domain-containing protein [Actinomycetota bacterium]